MSTSREGVFRAAALERLSSPEQLDERMRVVSPRAWLAFAALAALLLAAVLWGVLGRVPLKAHGNGRAMGGHAVVFIPAAEARRIQAGMAAQISAVTHDGVLPSRVSRVSERPASRAEMLEAFGAEDQVRRLAATGAFAVELDTGGASSLPAGVPCQASIIVAEQRPIAFVFPALARVSKP